ncbi:MAG: hypothetical protein ACI8S6_003347 [Myxococcota bacterium]|jgi:hypothetical protein
MDTSEARRLLSYFYYANAVVIALIGLLPAAWAILPAAMIISAPDPGFAMFTGAMMIIPIGISLVAELTAAAMIATGIAIRSGNTTRLLVAAAALTFFIPPIGPILSLVTIGMVYADRQS